MKATAFGINSTVTGIGRIVGAAIMDNIFAWSEDNNNIYPFNFVFVFYILGIMAFISSGCIFLFPKQFEATIQNKIKNVKIFC